MTGYRAGGTGIERRRQRPWRRLGVPKLGWTCWTWVAVAMVGLAAGGIHYLLAIQTPSGGVVPGEFRAAAEVAALIYLVVQVALAFLMMLLAVLSRRRRISVRVALVLVGVLAVVFALMNLSGSWATLIGGGGQMVLIAAAVLMTILDTTRFST
ncbi:MAG: hypothetical protein JO100_13320 [Pseudonocardia sp.]|nr:hypothetical protein [Pseudonocardia sp.]